MSSKRIITPDFVTGVLPSRNLASKMHPMASSQFVSGTAVGEASGTRTDPDFWGRSGVTGSDLGVSWSTSTPLDGDMQIVTTNNSATNAAGTAFIETPLVGQLRANGNDGKIYVSFDALGGSVDGEWDVVLVQYNSSNVFQQKQIIAGGRLARSAATPGSSVVPATIDHFHGVATGSTNTTDKFALRFRHLSGSAALEVTNIYIGATPPVHTITYTPTISNATNTSVVTPRPTTAVIVGDYAQVSGVVSIGASGGDPLFGVSLPANTIFTDADDSEGGGVIYNITDNSVGYVRPILATNPAVIFFQSTIVTGNTRVHRFTFGYRIKP